MSKHQLLIHNINKTIEVDENKSILDALDRSKIAIKTSCGGIASCGECMIKIIKGENNISKINFAEGKILGNVFHITKERLACQTKMHGNIEIEIMS